MDAAEFVYWVNQNAARVKEYCLGCDGTGGKCDCIGLIIGAWRLSGNSWPWVHGSNYAARYLTRNLGASQALKMGDLVYKARPPGTEGYSLPDRYRDSGDLLDYYHVGVVTSESPLEITHCTVGGIKRDTSRGKWEYSGEFSKVIYGGDAMEEKTVWSANGKPVNLRNSYSTAAKVIAQMPVGSKVEVLDYPDNKWAHVRYKDKVGYCMTEFLRDDDYDIVMELDKLIDEVKTTSALWIEQLKQIRERLP